MYSNLTKCRKNIAALALFTTIIMVSLLGRLDYLVLLCSEHYSVMAEDLHQGERTIKAARRRIIDANGVVIADNRTVCTISVVYNQVKDREQVIRVPCDEPDLNEELVRKQMKKRSSRGIIKTNVNKELGDQICSYRLAGVKVDEGYKRYYPCDSLASKALRFIGGNNQSITGLEVRYEKYLKGMNGKMLITSDVKDVEIEDTVEDRTGSILGNNFHINLDVNIQKYAEQLAYQVPEEKNAKKVSITVMNPQNGELMAMVNIPEFSLNDPFTLNQNLWSQSLQEMAAANQGATGADEQGLLDQIWRNTCINDIYEPGSTFKIITAVAGPESGMVKLIGQFSCPRSRMVGDRKIRCHKVGGCGAETLLQGIMNLCNSVFIDMGQRLGADGCYKYLTQFELKGKMGIDLPGEAATTMHKKENMGLVELATVSFDQSFQITPVRFITAVASVVNGGNRVTPHFGVETVSADDISVRELDYPSGGRTLSKETSATMWYVLKRVVSGESGKRAKLEGYRIGDKAVMSERLPRSLRKYISSFIGFVSTDGLQVMALITIDEPEGIYYGGTITTSVVGDLFKNILLYLGTEAVQEEIVVHLPNPQLIILGKGRILITK